MKKIFLIIILSPVLIFAKGAFVDKSIIQVIDNAVLSSFSVNTACVSEDDMMKYENTQVYSEYLCTNFIRFFNNTNHYLNISLLKDSLSEEEYTSQKYFTASNRRYAIARGAVDINRYTESEIISLVDKTEADAYIKIEADLKLWAQSITLKISAYNKKNALFWQDEVKAVSTYIIKDIASPYAGEFEVFGEGGFDASQSRSHEDELYIMLSEAISNCASLAYKRLDEELDNKISLALKAEKEYRRELKKERRKRKVAERREDRKKDLEITKQSYRKEREMRKAEKERRKREREADRERKE